jgi:hypothetical protein
MRRILGRVVVVCASALFIGAFAPACVENDQSIFVRAVLAPSTNRQNGLCVYTDDPQQTALFEGTLDVAIRDNYKAVVLVGSQMLNRGDPATARAEPNRVHLNGAVVKVMEPDGAVIGEFTSLATGFADVQQNNNPDYGLMSIIGIDKPTADTLRGQVGSGATKQIVLQMKAFGKTLGGIDLESSEFQFPLQICNGCLINFGTADTARPAGEQCTGAISTSGGGQVQLPCNPGQDGEAVPCQLCSARARGFAPNICDR